ncbi:MAG: ABC transporter permease [Candidatus Gracilibacteria bacterium]|nr:ABC transporter permease [Candidatus Gracilibacteria bacterium]
MRSFLSILGLVIGVFSVTVMVSVGEGLQSQILGEFQAAATNTITIIAGPSFNPFAPQRSAELPGFTTSDINFFKQSMGFITKITPIAELTESVIIKGEKVDVRIAAGDKEYMDIEGYKILEGRGINDNDSKNYESVVVISENVVKDYLKISNKEAIGKDIIIGGQYFSIIGVVGDKGGGIVDVKLAVIPISTAQQKITGDPFYPYLIFKIDESIPSTEAVKLVKYTLLKWQGASNMEDALFQVISTETMKEQISNITNMLQLALGGIGAISLLVGGIGVMNIMLVSVTERTREIGIRKAIGARYIDILLQFLTESVLLGMLGCIIGVLLSWLVILGLQQVGVPALLNLKTILIAVIFAGGTGVIFGVGPARKAAKMKPIDALRYE